MMQALIDGLLDDPQQGGANLDHLSYSAISTFRRCPLRFHFRHVLGLPETSTSAALVFGAAIHASVEHHFRELLAGNPPPDLDQLLAEYHGAWQDRAVGEIRFAKGDGQDSLGQLAERMLRAFQVSGFARPQGKIIAVEEELRGPIISGCPDILARVDLVIADNDGLVITDFKTARSRWSPGHVQDAAEQLYLYHELIQPLVGSKPVRLQFAVLTKAKEPVLEVHQVPFRPRDIMQTRRLVEAVWQAIQAGVRYPCPSPIDCPGCSFREPCRHWPEIRG